MSITGRNQQSLVSFSSFSDKRHSHHKSLSTLTESTIPQSTRASASIMKNVKKRPSISYLYESSQIKKSVRHDGFGNEIVKGSKSHKVSFVDNISNARLAEVILFDSATKSNKVTCECNASCGIF